MCVNHGPWTLPAVGQSMTLLRRAIPISWPTLHLWEPTVVIVATHCWTRRLRLRPKRALVAACASYDLRKRREQQQQRRRRRRQLCLRNNDNNSPRHTGRFA